MKLCSNSTCSSAARLKRCTALETIYRASIRHASGCEKPTKPAAAVATPKSLSRNCRRLPERVQERFSF
ncbi:hypothetical protein RHECNPAF_1330024 [Rhizobium etli CNPAF512]|nr:hypothetical protein RHECNPAF_1330024 [Rhizobium etli CNPAF512]